MKTIILENLDFTWDTQVIKKVIKMWNGGVPFSQIAKTVERKQEETFLLLMHLSLEGRIKKRKNAIWGNAIEKIKVS